MRITVIEAPLDSNFEKGSSYEVYGENGRSPFVFDDNVESYFLSEIEYEVCDE